MPATPETISPEPRKARVLLRRLLSSLVLWSLVLTVMFSAASVMADCVLLGMLMLVATAGLAEFYGLWEKRERTCFKWTGLLAGAVLIVGTFFIFTGRFGMERTPSAVNHFEAGFFALFVLGLCVRMPVAGRKATGVGSLAITVFGVVYVTWLLNFMQKLCFIPGIEPHGRFYLLYLIAVTKFSDTGAYVFGALTGRHPMAPRISPGKTWEGFCGAILFSTGTSLMMTHFAGERLAHIRPPHAAMLGVMLGLVAVAGDLIESVFKRKAGVKDSGASFPGIGGVLDLIDSLLFTAPVLYLYLCCFGTRTTSP